MQLHSTLLPFSSFSADTPFPYTNAWIHKCMNPSLSSLPFILLQFQLYFPSGWAEIMAQFTCSYIYKFRWISSTFPYLFFVDSCELRGMSSNWLNSGKFCWVCLKTPNFGYLRLNEFFRIWGLKSQINCFISLFGLIYLCMCDLAWFGDVLKFSDVLYAATCFLYADVCLAYA